jgi:DnaK suppressor protein
LKVHLSQPYSRQRGPAPSRPALRRERGIALAGDLNAMAKKLTKKQIEVLQQRLLRERDRALRSLGQFDELAKQSAEQNDSDSYSYSDHMADLGTDAMEREKMLLFASKEGRYLYRVEEALRRLYKEPDSFGMCHSCGKLIDFERLEALPHARYCIDCKLKEEAA